MKKIAEKFYRYSNLRYVFAVIMLLFFLIGAGFYAAPCFAVETSPAVDITKESLIEISNQSANKGLLSDGKYTTRVRFDGGGEIKLQSTNKVASLYLVWDKAPKQWALTLPSGSVTVGTERFLHQYIELETEQNQIAIQFNDDAVLCEVVLLTKGKLPPNIQNWSNPLEKADMLLLPTHADDEHLYFGGTMAAYTARGKAVQVAYMVNHNGEPYRPHELLNGLWTVGIRNYPIIPDFKDQYSESLEHAKTIYKESDILAYQVELIRRFKPEVIVGHDINGEYGHGAHRLNAATLQKAVVSAADEKEQPESFLAYGVWDTKKTYQHLWYENPIVMNWDIPLPEFEGATPFEMAEKGFACHYSQQEFFKVLQKGPYDCRKFGLFRSTVGVDVEKNDFFENIPIAAASSQEEASSENISSVVLPSSENAPVSSQAPTSSVPPQKSGGALTSIWLIIGVVLIALVITFIFYTKTKK